METGGDDGEVDHEALGDLEEYDEEGEDYDAGEFVEELEIEEGDEEALKMFMKMTGAGNKGWYHYYQAYVLVFNSHCNGHRLTKRTLYIQLV